MIKQIRTERANQALPIFLGKERKKKKKKKKKWNSPFEICPVYTSFIHTYIFLLLIIHLPYYSRF